MFLNGQNGNNLNHVSLMWKFWTFRWYMNCSLCVIIINSKIKYNLCLFPYFQVTLIIEVLVLFTKKAHEEPLVCCNFLRSVATYVHQNEYSLLYGSFNGIGGWVYIQTLNVSFWWLISTGVWLSSKVLREHPLSQE